MTEPLIKLENVWKVYQLGKVGLTALKNISLEIAPGAFISIMGPSGSGKSTLLNIVGALDSPSQGKVILKGKDISQLTEDNISQLRGKTIGFVFQEFNLLPNLTAIENVMLPMTFQGIPEAKRKERAQGLLRQLGLAERIFHLPGELSAGERQRVAMARAFANDPELVIADEPTGNLDSATGQKIMEILTNFHRNQGKTIILVTHDINVANYSQTIINIKDGQIWNSSENILKLL